MMEFQKYVWAQILFIFCSVEEHVIKDTYGLLAVTCVGDFDNDGKNEINVGAVGVSFGEPYMSWIFKYIPQT